MNNFDYNSMKLCHIIKYHNVFKFQNGPYHIMPSGFIALCYWQFLIHANLAMVGAFVSYRHIFSLLFFQGPSFSTSPLVKLLIEPASLKDGFKFASTITIPDIQFDYTGDYTCRLDQMHSINSSVYVYASGTLPAVGGILR